MSGFAQWFHQLNFDRLIVMLITAASCLLCICVHETCHGLAALAMGDTTAKDAGRLSLNPLRHVDLFGFLMLVIVRFGWAKPVPVNASRFRNPRLGMALTALAGPVSNVILAAVSLLISYILLFFQFRHSWLGYFTSFFSYTAVISCGLAVFNLIPIPPLDGSKVLFSLLPVKPFRVLLRYERYGMFLLMGLLLLGVLDTPLSVMRDGLLSLLERVCFWPVKLLLQI